MCHGQMIGDALLKARKEHRCSECGGEIRRGKLYRRYRWVDGADTPATVKLCERCNAMNQDREQYSDEACYYLGKARNDYRENTVGEGWWRDLRARLRDTILRTRKTYGKA